MAKDNIYRPKLVVSTGGSGGVLTPPTKKKLDHITVASDVNLDVLRDGVNLHTTEIAASTARITTNETHISENLGKIDINTQGVEDNKKVTDLVPTTFTGKKGYFVAVNTAENTFELKEVKSGGGSGVDPADQIKLDHITITQDLDLDTFKTDIATNTTTSNINAASITTAQTDIGTNTTGIATNKTDIATNKTSIVTNASSITSNTGNITSNTSLANTAIGAAAHAQDVANTAQTTANSAKAAADKLPTALTGKSGYSVVVNGAADGYDLLHITGGGGGGLDPADKQKLDFITVTKGANLDDISENKTGVDNASTLINVNMASISSNTGNISTVQQIANTAKATADKAVNSNLGEQPSDWDDMFNSENGSRNVDGLTGNGSPTGAYKWGMVFNLNPDPGKGGKVQMYFPDTGSQEVLSGDNGVWYRTGYGAGKRNWAQFYSTANKPTKADIGLSNVENVKALGATETATDSNKLGGHFSSEYAKSVDVNGKVDKTGGTITGDLEITGELKVHGDITAFFGTTILDDQADAIQTLLERIETLELQVAQLQGGE